MSSDLVPPPSTLVRPRLTEYHGVFQPQSLVDFAIPFFNEDLPLYLDPFLLWKSPSLQDQGLHRALIDAFNNLGALSRAGKVDEARELLIQLSECEEVGLGNSGTRRGKRIGSAAAHRILRLFQDFPHYATSGFRHLEEVQLYVEGISRDRISDIACNYLKSFLIDYTTQECERLGIPVEEVDLPAVYDHKVHALKPSVKAELPLHPETRASMLLVPKRWLRHVPWIAFEDYFQHHAPKDNLVHEETPDARVRVLTFNRENYGAVETYIRAKELSAADCHNDPLFKQIPVRSARQKLKEIQAIPSGNNDKADKRYENAVVQLLSTLLYPDLDFAAPQSRTIDGSLIRDLIFYNSSKDPFLAEILKTYGSRQLVFELKNVKAIESMHINQLNRYLSNDFGSFGILVCRNALKSAMLRNTVALWAGQRRTIITLTDADLELMVEAYDGMQRRPVEVIKKKYLEFKQACPS